MPLGLASVQKVEDLAPVQSRPGTERYPGLDGLASGDTDAGPAVCLAEARSPYAQRFAAARALGMYLVDHSGKLVLLTGAEVTRQQFSRAFAAEFLAPREQLRARLGDYADEDDILELSEEFGVSERVIRHQIANNKLARLVESPDQLF